MDRHDVGRDRGGVAAGLRTITCPFMVMGIDSDLLYPLHEQEELAAHIPSCQYRVVKSTEGHDGFLLAQDQVSKNLDDFFRIVENGGDRQSNNSLDNSNKDETVNVSGDDNDVEKPVVSVG